VAIPENRTLPVLQCVDVYFLEIYVYASYVEGASQEMSDTSQLLFLYVIACRERANRCKVDGMLMKQAFSLLNEF
jgi:hypothetical protein